MTPQNRNSNSEGLINQVVATLAEEIRSGRWPVGSRIPTEPELCTLAGVGRNTVREAVQSLVHAGLLRRRQGSGTYVIADNELSVLVADWTHNRYTTDDAATAARDIWLGTVRQAAQHRTDEQAAELRQAATELSDQPVPLARVQRRDETPEAARHLIHPVVQEVLSAANNTFQHDVLAGILTGLAASSELHWDAMTLADTLRHIADGDGAAAATAANSPWAELTNSPEIVANAMAAHE